MNNEVIFNYLRYACFYYVPSKPNRKKIKELIHAMPYFIREDYQSVLFDTIHNNPIESYWDNNKSMNEYGYLIYKQFYIKTNDNEPAGKKYRIKEYEDYINELNTPYNDFEYKRKRTHHILFTLFLILLFYLLYKTLNHQ
jgi:hypothetical protein